MENIIIILTNLWILANRKKYLSQWAPYLLTLIHASEHLQRDFHSRHSNLARGCILPHQQEAVQILNNAVMELDQRLSEVRAMTFAKVIGLNTEFSIDIKINL